MSAHGVMPRGAFAHARVWKVWGEDFWDWYCNECDQAAPDEATGLTWRTAMDDALAHVRTCSELVR